MKPKALDLFWLLRQLNAKRYELGSELTEEQLKEVAPVVVLRWLASTTNPAQVLALNELANRLVFHPGFSKPRLLATLATATAGQAERYQWQPAKQSVSPMARQVLQESLGCSAAEARLYLPQVPMAELLATAETLGWEPEQTQRLRQELEQDAREAV